jgi:hypothetical protein
VVSVPWRTRLVDLGVPDFGYLFMESGSSKTST